MIPGLILDRVDDEGLTILNTGAITRHARSPMTPSALDLGIVSAGLSLDTDWKVYDDSMGSDHFPTIIGLNFENSPIKRLKKRKND